MSEEKPKIGCKIGGTLVALGAINWGLIGIFQVDLFAQLFANAPVVSRVVYGIIGAAGLFQLIRIWKPCCGGSCKTQG